MAEGMLRDCIRQSSFPKSSSIDLDVCQIRSLPLGPKFLVKQIGLSLKD